MINKKIDNLDNEQAKSSKLDMVKTLSQLEQGNKSVNKYELRS